VASEQIKRAIQHIGTGLADAFKAILGSPEEAPPVGGRDVYGGEVGAPTVRAAPTIAGGTTGLLLIGLLVWAMMKKGRR